METNRFFAYAWHQDEIEENITSLRIYGLDEKNKNICIRVDDFTPYVYLELPDDRSWTDSDAQKIGNKLDELLYQSKPLVKHLMWKRRLYYAKFENGNHKKFPYLFCSFSCIADIKTLQYKISRGLNIAGLGFIKLRMHEQTAWPALQFTSLQKIPTAGWSEFIGKRIKGETMKTSCDKEYIVKWKNIKPYEKIEVANPLIMGMDIEVNSSNPNAFPNAGKPEDKIFQIACVFSRHGTDYREKFLLSLFDPDQKATGNDITIRTFETEGDLLRGYTALIQEKQPNIIVGYNILGFDIPYMTERAKHTFCLAEFDVQGFIKGYHAKEETIVWSSSAYKDQEFQFLDAEGRLFIDLLPLVRRDFSLSNYKLTTISKHLLGSSKDPLSVKGIFKCYRMGKVGNEIEATKKEKASGRKAMGVVGKYCVQDTDLCVRLMDKLQTWVGLCEMAKTCCVPPFFLYTQGQQVKVYAQVYAYCTHTNYVVEKDGYITGKDEHYTGAVVFDPVPGVYEKVVPVDFASLYPTIMIAYNIDYSTLVTDESIPNHMCHVMEWEDHQGCVHDPVIIEKMRLTEIINAGKDELKRLRNKRNSTTDKFLKMEYANDIKKLTADLKPHTEARSKCKSTYKHAMCVKRKYRFLKDKHGKGVLPTILQNLLDARKHTRSQMKELGKILKGSKPDLEAVKPLLSESIFNKIGKDISIQDKLDIQLLIDVLNKRQLSYKISCNSMYGAMGVSKSRFLPFMPGAMATTAMGRKSNRMVADIIPKKYGGKLIYGDSVSADTPLMIKFEEGSVDIQTIDTIGKSWNKYGKGDKEQSFIEAKTWVNGKWNDIKRVIRHKAGKKMYRILTHVGCVDVTEDHSLLTKDGVMIKPGDVKVGDELLHSFPTVFEEFDVNNIEGFFKTKECSKCKVVRPEYEFYNSKVGDIFRTCKKCCYLHNHREKTSDMINEYFSETEYLERKDNPLTKEEAFAMGFFMGDGSCGRYECPSGIKYSWALNNQNLEYLERAASYLRKSDPEFEFKILDTLASSGVYKLVPTGKLRLIVEKYRQIFYNKRKQKVVPYSILNASVEIKEWFFEGYYAADGHKTEKGTIIPKKGALRMDCKGKLGTQGLFYILKSIGYNVSINTRESKPDIFRLNATKGSKFRKSPIKIKKILELPLNEEEYVYDLETYSGVFQAGIGEMIVKNTDSCYVTFEECKTPKDLWEYSEHVAAEVSKLFPAPMELEFEEVIYWRFLILSKKRYMYWSCGKDGILDKVKGKDGKPTDVIKIGNKGILLTRRDNSPFVRNIYSDVIMKIFEKVDRDLIIQYIIDKINDLCSGAVNYNDFVITKSVGSVGGSGTLKAVPFINDKGVKKGKIGSYTVPLLSTDVKIREQQFKLKKASDEQEYYARCLPAVVQLSLKMARRGTPVDSGTRLEYLILSLADGYKSTDKQYEKIEALDYYKNHRRALKVDVMYYTKALANPLDQVLNIVCGNRERFKRNIVLEQYNLRLKVRRKVMEELEEIFTPKIEIIG